MKSFDGFDDVVRECGGYDAAARHLYYRDQVGDQVIANLKQRLGDRQTEVVSKIRMIDSLSKTVDKLCGEKATLAEEYEAHTAELEEKIVELEQVIDSNDYQMRTVWYKGREWACIQEVDALVRKETQKIRNNSIGVKA